LQPLAVLCEASRATGPERTRAQIEAFMRRSTAGTLAAPDPRSEQASNVEARIRTHNP
jgi:hypothetical protein